MKRSASFLMRTLPNWLSSFMNTLTPVEGSIRVSDGLGNPRYVQTMDGSDHQEEIQESMVRWAIIQSKLGQCQGSVIG